MACQLARSSRSQIGRTQQAIGVAGSIHYCRISNYNLGNSGIIASGDRAYERGNTGTVEITTETPAMTSNDDENSNSQSANAAILMHPGGTQDFTRGPRTDQQRELIARSSRDASAAPRRRHAMARGLLPLGLVTALVSTGCLAGTNPGDDEPLLVGGKTGTAELALGDTLASRVTIITGKTDEREGWGKGATGGASGTIYHVTNLQDAGSGSLREALEASGPRWIIFDVSGTIALQSSVHVKSDKTVDARGKQIVIKASDQGTTAFTIESQHNVILINLEFDNDWPAFDMDSEGADAINIVNSHDIWIHHCEFLQWSDGAIDMKKDTDGDANYNVSVMWSRFRKIFQPMLWEGDQLSLGHSVCGGQVNARCPKIIFGRVHSYNNYIADWGIAAIQNAKSGGQLYSQLNMFEPGNTNEVNKRDDPETDKIENDGDHAFHTVKFLGGSNLVDSIFKAQSHSNAKFDVCSTDSCWTALQNRLLNGDSVHAAAGNSL
jgi:pectate lyase